MKIIDLLIKKANGTLEDDFKFKYDGREYKYIKEDDNFLDYTCSCLGENYITEEILNDEVEILDNNKVLEKLSMLDEGSDNKALFNYCVNIEKKINEIIDYINKNKEENK